MNENILIKSEKHTLLKNILIGISTISAIVGLCVCGVFSYGFTGNFGEAFGVTTPFLGIVVICVLLYLRIVNCELIITDKRVYGKATFGKRVDLPIDAVSAVGTSSLWGIDVGTSSGRIHFKLIKNKDEIHSVLSGLLMDRQQKPANTVVQNTTSNADELEKFKELLDKGIITQEEFDAKKKQLLGL